MPNSERFSKTVAKLLGGALPKSSGERAERLPGNGDACNGCGEAIVPPEERYLVTARELIQMRFHAECYSAWATYL